MSEKKRPGVMLYFTLRPCLQRLSFEQQGKLLAAIFAYAFDETEPQFDDVMVGVAFDFVRPLIDRDAENYMAKSEAGRKGAKLRWNKATVEADDATTDSNVCTPMANDANACEAMANDANACEAIANDANACTPMANDANACEAIANDANACEAIANDSKNANINSQLSVLNHQLSIHNHPISISNHPFHTSNHTEDFEKSSQAAKPPRARSSIPEESQVISFFIESGKSAAEAGQFYDYYAANGWLVGKNKMKDWRAAARNWMRRSAQYGPGPAAQGPPKAAYTAESFIEQMKRVSQQMDERAAQKGIFL